MKAAVLTRFNMVEWMEMEKPNCKPDEVLIQVSYACICGSDQYIFKGEFHPRTQEGFEMLETNQEDQLQTLLDLRD